MTTTSRLFDGKLFEGGLFNGGIFESAGITLASLIASLFGAGEQGGLYLPGLDTCYTDNGTTLCTAPGDLVYRVDDLSGNGNHASQGTTALRPIYAKHPATGVRNLLTYTQEFSNYNWASRIVDATLTSGVSDPFGGTSAYTLTSTGTLGRISHVGVNLTAGDVVTTSLWVKRRAGTSSVLLYDSRTISSNQAKTVTSEWTRVNVQATVDTTGARYPGILIFGPPNAVDIFGFQFEHTNLTNYQKVVSAYDVSESGVNDAYLMLYDGVDDVMTLSNPALGSSATVARSLPVTGASILQNQTIGANYADNVTNHALILLDRNLTTAEEAMLTAYLNIKAGL